MYRRINTYESQIVKKGKNGKNLIIEVRQIPTGLLVYVESRTTLEVKMGQLYRYGSDWSWDEAMEVAEEAIAISDDQKLKAENVKPEGVFIIRSKDGHFTIVWNCEVPEDKQEQETTSVDMSKAVARA